MVYFLGFWSTNHVETYQGVQRFKNRPQKIGWVVPDSTIPNYFHYEIYYTTTTFLYMLSAATMSMELIQSTFAPIKPPEDLDHHHVETWTLKYARWNKTTYKLISQIFYFIDSVWIDKLKSVCYLLIILIKCEMITSQKKISFDCLDSLIIDNLTNVCSIFIISDKEESIVRLLIIVLQTESVIIISIKW